MLSMGVRTEGGNCRKINMVHYTHKRWEHGVNITERWLWLIQREDEDSLLVLEICISVLLHNNPIK